MGPFLAPLAAVFGLAVRFRGLAYDRGWSRVRRLRVPVVSVGNLSVGGTGKTPLVEWVVRSLAGRGVRAGVLSRGYGGGDEVKALAEALPGVAQGVGADRYQAGLDLLARCPVDALVLDDGFQHRALARDLDVVAVDATRPPWEDDLLPAGRLREGLAALARAGLVVVTRAECLAAEDLAAVRDRVAGMIAAPVVVSANRPVGLRTLDGAEFAGPYIEPGWLQGRRVAAFAGIGNPGAFRRFLGVCGAEVVVFRALGDHHPYGPGSLADLIRWGEAAGVEALVTTTKDAVKLRRPPEGGPPVLVLVTRLEVVEGQEVFERVLLGAVGR